MITFSCTCGKKYRTDDRLSGKLIRCSACGEAVRVPGVPEPGSPPQAKPSDALRTVAKVAAHSPTRERSPDGTAGGLSPQHTSRGPNWKAIAISITVVATVVVIIMAVLMARRSSTTSNPPQAEAASQGVRASDSGTELPSQTSSEPVAATPPEVSGVDDVRSMLDSVAEGVRSGHHERVADMFVSEDAALLRARIVNAKGLSSKVLELRAFLRSSLGTDLPPRYASFFDGLTSEDSKVPEAVAKLFIGDGPAQVRQEGSDIVVVLKNDQKVTFSRTSAGWRRRLSLQSRQDLVAMAATDEALQKVFSELRAGVTDGTVTRSNLSTHLDRLKAEHWAPAMAKLVEEAGEESSTMVQLPEGGRAIKTGYPVRCVVFVGGPDRAASCGGGGDERGHITIWDVSTGKKLHEVKRNTPSFFGMAATPDGRRIVTGCGLDMNGLGLAPRMRLDRGEATVKGDVGVMEWNDRLELVAFKKIGKVHVGTVTMSADGKRVLIDAGFNLTYAGELGNTTYQWLHAGGLPSSMRRFRLCVLAISPNGQFLASVAWHDGTFSLCDLRSASLMWSFSEDDIGRILSVAFSPDGQYVLAGGKQGLLGLRDAATGKRVRSFLGHRSRVHAVAFSSDGKLAVSAGGPGLGHYEGWRGDDEPVESDTSVRLWEVDTGRQIALLGNPDETVYSVAVSPSGREAIAGSADGSVYIYPLPD